MIWLILLLFAMVGIAGYLWVDNQCLKEQLRDTEYAYWDVTEELDPVEVYNLREEKADD